MGPFEKNYYDVLSLKENADAREIHEGYLRAKNAYAEDALVLYSIINSEERKKILNLIDVAYSVLSDPRKRREYDQSHGFNEGPSEGSAEEVTSFEERSASSTQKESMVKIVSQKKFSLKYDRDEAFEQEIEQTVNFSGDFLKRIREYKNVDISVMSDLTKVSKTYLTYIENEEFAKLPAPVYVRGFIFQYSKCLKLNPEIVTSSFMKRLKKNSG